MSALLSQLQLGGKGTAHTLLSLAYHANLLINFARVARLIVDILLGLNRLMFNVLVFGS